MRGVEVDRFTATERGHPGRARRTGAHEEGTGAAAARRGGLLRQDVAGRRGPEGETRAGRCEKTGRGKPPDAGRAAAADGRARREETPGETAARRTGTDSGKRNAWYVCLR